VRDNGWVAPPASRSRPWAPSHHSAGATTVDARTIGTWKTACIMSSDPAAGTGLPAPPSRAPTTLIATTPGMICPTMLKIRLLTAMNMNARPTEASRGIARSRLCGRVIPPPIVASHARTRPRPPRCSHGMTSARAPSSSTPSARRRTISSIVTALPHRVHVKAGGTSWPRRFVP
jgi:hypothetical protein